MRENRRGSRLLRCFTDTAGLLLVVALAASGLAHAAEDVYVVRLTRPAKVGDRYSLDSKGSVSVRHRFTRGGKAGENQEKALEVRLLASVTVLAVDGKSRSTRTAYLIESCQKVSSGRMIDVVAPGSRVVAEHDGARAVFTVDGKPARADVAEALDVVIAPHAFNSATDDEIFGARESKRVGDQWNVNTEAAARDFSGKDVLVGAKDLSGTVRLEGLRTVDGVKALQVSAGMRADRLNVPVPAGVELEEATMEADLTDLVPVDPQVPVLLSERIHIRVSFRLRGPKSETKETVSVEGGREASLENKYSPAKDGGDTRPTRTPER